MNKRISLTALLLALTMAGPLTGQVRPRQGLRIVRTLPAAPQPQVKLYGAAGSTTYTYFVTSTQTGFESTAGSATITNAPASPSSGDAVGIFWKPQAGADSYRVYKVTGTAEPASGANLLCSTSANYCYDTGQALTPGFPPATAPASNSNISTIAPDAGAQVYNVKAYGARGDDLGDDEPAFGAAIAAMPPCSQAGHTWTHCGTAFVPAGTYLFAEPLAITSPFVTVEGENAGTSSIDSRVGASQCTITVTANPFNPDQDDTNAGGIFGLTIDGTNATSGASGICATDIVGFKTDATVENFTGGAGIEDFTASFWNERWTLDATLANNHFGILFQNSDGHSTTFGYGTSRLHINVNGGEFGLYFNDSSSNPIVFDAETGSIVCNIANTGICVETNSAFTTIKFYGLIHAEQSSGSGGTGISGGASVALIDSLEFYALGTNILTTQVAAKQANFLETFANLPPASNTGWTAAISDSNTATFHASAAGGGANHVRVFSDGTSWLVY